MDRVFSSGAAGSPPSAPASPSSGYPTAGNPGTGTPATKPGPWWYYMMTEELRAVIVAAGLTPDHTNVNQLVSAIQQLIAAGSIKLPVRAATTANIASLAGGAPNTLDGVTLFANDRILVKDQTVQSQNGIYVVKTLGTGANGTWTRATDADGNGELIAGCVVVVSEGTANADSLWELATDGAITIGTTSLSFSQKNGITQSQADARYCGIGYMLVRDEKASGTTGGASTVAVLTRTLNTVVANTISGASLASNQITLPAGTYRVRAVVPSYNLDRVKGWLYNVTDSTIAAVGDEGDAASAGDARSIITGRFTIASAKVFELRMNSINAMTDGLGYPASASGVVEVYSVVEIHKES